MIASGWLGSWRRSWKAQHTEPRAQRRSARALRVPDSRPSRTAAYATVLHPPPTSTQPARGLRTHLSQPVDRAQHAAVAGHQRLRHGQLQE